MLPEAYYPSTFYIKIKKVNIYGWDRACERVINTYTLPHNEYVDSENAIM